MEHWNDIRKSDDQFIHDIYEKANQYEYSRVDKKRNNKFSTKYKMFRYGLELSAAAASLIILTTTMWKGYQEGTQQSTTPQNTMYRSLEDEDEIQDARTTVEQPVEDVPVEIVGVITDVVEDAEETVLQVRGKSVDHSNEQFYQVIVSKEVYNRLIQYQKEHHVEQLSDFKVLLYVETYNWLDYLKLNNDSSLYVQVTSQKDSLIYESLDGQEQICK